MAHTLPDGWDTTALTSSAASEIETLRQLAAKLPEDWTVYHGVHWTKVERGYSVYGEVDFLVRGPQGQIVLIEQKRGQLEETADGLIKRYPDKSKVVKIQMQRSLESLQSRFKQGHHGERLVLDYLLYCPDHRVLSPATAGIAPERIVDARHPERLCQVVTEVITTLATARGPSPDAVHAFLANELDLAIDPSAFQGQARRWVTRLSGGLATWARRLEFDPFRLRVVGTAGSGKTQLALRVLDDAAAKAQRSLYVCFNRPLADRIASLSPNGARAATFHMLGDQVLRARGERPDFRALGIYNQLANAFVETSPVEAEQVDVLVVDEGQDFNQTWADSLLRWVRPGGKAWWLEDPMQNLYDKPEVSLPGWVKLHADTNYRTPRDVLEQVGRISRGRRAEAGSPLDGGFGTITSYSDFDSLVDATAAAVQRARQSGFRDQDIVILTFAGRERSRLMMFDSIRGTTLRRFDGAYDPEGRPIFQEGDVLIETVYRFKGQSAFCIVLTEVDFDDLDVSVERKLYVGATRAMIHLEIVLSDRAARRLIDRLA